MGIPKGAPGEWLCARLKPGDVVLDVGANTGSLTKAFASAVGSAGLVIAYEPDHRCWSDLEQLHGPVRIIRKAVGAETGPGTFCRAANTQQSSRYRGAVSEPADQRDVDCEMVTLDATAPDVVAAVKVDVQGGEADVLAGAWRVLQTCPLWVLEMWPHGLKAAGSSVRAILDRMESAGYTVLALDNTPVTREQLLRFEQESNATNYINVAFVK